MKGITDTAMDFWHEFTKSISDAASSTVKEAEKLTDMAKVKYRISSLKTKLDESYLTVGQLKYAEFRGENVPEEMYDGLFEQITDLTNQINDLETRLSDLRNLVACKNCGARINKKGCAYCPKCGEKIE